MNTELKCCEICGGEANCRHELLLYPYAKLLGCTMCHKCKQSAPDPSSWNGQQDRIAALKAPKPRRWPEGSEELKPEDSVLYYSGTKWVFGLASCMIIGERWLPQPPPPPEKLDPIKEAFRRTALTPPYSDYEVFKSGWEAAHKNIKFSDLAKGFAAGYAVKEAE